MTDLSKFISDKIQIEIEEVSQVTSSKSNIPYRRDGSMFEPKGVSGYIRLKRTVPIYGEHRDLKYKSEYRLVLFLAKNTCDKDVLNIAANLSSTREYKIVVSEIFSDTVMNVNKEFKVDKYPDFMVIIIEMEVEYNFCKTTISC